MNTNERIWLSLAHMGGHEQRFVQEAFDTNWVVPMGPNVDAFETELAAFLQSNVYVAALSAGTASLHLALIILGVKQGDEVLCQSFTFSASANPIVYQGATPVFIDSEKDTWNMSPEHLERAIKDRISKGKKPKAIIPVHLYGMPAKIEEIQSISSKYEIPIIEDAAEALGSRYKSQHCGTFGEMAVLSFNGNKIITTSGGGALVAHNEEYIKTARFLATQARDAAPHYQHSHIGYNYRMSNVVAGIGRGQMLVLEDRIKQRRTNNEFYRKGLEKVEGISFQTEPSSDYFSNYWLTSILVNPLKTGGKTREDIYDVLNENNIESRPLWKPMHMQPIFSGCPYYGDGTSERLFREGLCLPSGTSLSFEDVDRVIKAIESMF
ncbi:aminotransferase class I/II-fold pyridoxal phosphate-dependent enzyme [Dysgonomonas mossii]|uniref:GDP-perosamine synthase n=1 Tax=Dysgonomonas mossii TaxID=163665 RepID=A0A4Y9IU28_9BACT|nr:aminotransferase class I/II-fold pyridoxal phosphate-dependent enzyme [Dysgonomonas mossii]MBF0760442.1 aminotransferase class I/II-fold pyridoxal phosphate-dependent enzyme [Dysgonomonas mossii]TFU91468.1 aminotransferase class I/II-fold pyridoxal phosphate-dependent enzyme [Dysgonomonas mossii]